MTLWRFGSKKKFVEWKKLVFVIPTMDKNDTVDDDGFDTDVECFNFSTADLELMEFHIFWFEGVVLCVLAVLGSIANVVSIVILNK